MNDMTKPVRYLIVGIAGMLSLLAAFFIVFNTLFSDIFTLRDRLIGYAMVSVAYAILGFGFAFARFNSWRWWAVFFSAPAVLMAALYTISEPQQFFVHAMTILLVVIATHGGAYLSGSRLRAKAV